MQAIAPLGSGFGKNYCAGTQLQLCRYDVRKASYLHRSSPNLRTGRACAPSGSHLSKSHLSGGALQELWGRD